MRGQENNMVKSAGDDSFRGNNLVKTYKVKSF